VTNGPLREALQPVLDDLDRSHPGLIEAVLWDRGPRDDPSNGGVLLRDADGHGPILRPQEEADIHVRWQVTDTAQEAVVEALWSAGKPAVWPNCPDHPNTHPLNAAISPSRALVWACPLSDRVICAVGDLPAE